MKIKSSDPTDLFKSRMVRCKHVHYSGRQCGVRISKTTDGPKVCLLHLEGRVCSECLSMKEAFVPPKGW